MASFDMHSTIKFATFSDFEKSGFSLKKTPIYFFQKKFVRFEKSYYFSRNLRQICFNLVKKNFQAQSCPDIASEVGHHHLASHRKTFALSR